MQVFQGSKLDIHHLVSQEPFHAWKQVLFGVLWTEDLGELVDRGRERLLNSQVIYLCQLVVQRLESWPLIRTEDIDKSWDVVGSMVAYILIATALSRRHVEINNFCVDVLSKFECCNKRTNILESSTTHKLGGRVLQESIVNLRQLFSLIFYSSHFGNFSHLVSTCFSHLLFAVQSQLIIQWENLVLEELERNDLAYVYKIAGYGDTHLHIFIHA